MVGIPFSASIFRIDGLCALHPFTLHKLDAGPIRLMTIAHAFNYRMAVLCDGVKSAARVGRFRKAEGCFLTDTDLSWGHQVAVMFQIISTLALELPSFLEALADIRVCPLMCNWTVNHGVIWTIAMDIVLVGLLIERRLMYIRSLWPSSPGGVCAVEDWGVGAF